MREDWNPASLEINPEVVNALKNGAVYWGDRFCGKTETLLAYIALNHQDAIIVSRLRSDSTALRKRFRQRYPTLIQPRFVSQIQFENADGYSGYVFTDDCPMTNLMASKLCYELRFGGGVATLVHKEELE